MIFKLHGYFYIFNYKTIFYTIVFKGFESKPYREVLTSVKVVSETLFYSVNKIIRLKSHELNYLLAVSAQAL